MGSEGDSCGNGGAVRSQGLEGGRGGDGERVEGKMEGWCTAMGPHERL